MTANEIELLKAQSIVANEYALMCNEALRHTDYAKPKLSNKYKGLLKEQRRLEEKEFFPIADIQKEAVDITYEITESFLKFSTLYLLEAQKQGSSKFGELIHILQAHNMNAPAMLKQANYIHKEKV